MANEFNYKNTLLSPYGSSKLLASRVFVNNLDALLELQLPTNVPSEFDVEISLYSLADNSLIYNATFSNNVTNLLQVKTLGYNGSVTPNERRLLFIDFSKIAFPFENITGRYQIVLNFFAREIGSFDSASLYVTNISNSGRELELQLRSEYNTPQNRQQLYNFASPQISNTWVMDALKQIFNQPNSTTSNIPTDKTALTYDIVTSFYSPETRAILANPNVSSATKAVIQSQVQSVLNRAYGIATGSVITQRGQGVVRFTRDNLINITSASLSTALQLTQTPEYKFV
jgi:hypothetical protein